MKIFAIDWEAFLDFQKAWRVLDLDGRKFLLAAPPKAVFTQAAVGGPLVRLLECGFLSGMADGERVRVSEAFHESHKVLRALLRYPFDGRADVVTLRDYLGEHFTSAERGALVQDEVWRSQEGAHLVATITSVGHVRGFLAEKDVRQWEKARLPEPAHWGGESEWTQARSLLKGVHAAADLVDLIRSLAATPGSLALSELALPGGSPARLANALEAGLRYLLCFAFLDAELLPRVRLWPSVSERLHRPKAKAPARAHPSESFAVPLRLEDLTQLLVRASDPLRLKQNGWTLFASAQRELESGLLTLPGWLLHPQLFPEHAPERRVLAAQRLAEELGMVEPRDAGSGLALATSAEGSDWLALGPKERLRRLLDPVRIDAAAEPSGADPSPFTGGDPLESLLRQLERLEADGEIDGEPFELRSHRPRSLPPLSEEALFGLSADGQLARAVQHAFATLAPGEPVLFRDFLAFHVQTNPLLGRGDLRRTPFGAYRGPQTEETLDEDWGQALCRVLHDGLLPYGGVRAGFEHSGLTIELTSIGRYLLGLADDFEFEALPAGEKPVHVQPDFEVVFVASQPALEAAIGRFAERRGRGVGTLFRITQASIVAAAQAGLEADEVLATLSSASRTPIPSNVVHEIRAWSGRCRRVALESAELLRCPDEATAMRVLALAGAKKLERLSATVLALLDPAQKATLVRQCRKAGIFLEAPRTGRLRSR